MTGKAPLLENSALSEPAISPLPKANAPEMPVRPPIIPPILLEGDEPAPLPAPPADISPVPEFVHAPKPRAELSKLEAGMLPEAYGTGRLLLVARDPRWLYAHWDLTDDQQRRYSALALDGELSIRVHRQSATGQVVTEARAHPPSRHAFIQVEDAGMEYVAELGYHQSGPQWVSLAVSNPVATPSFRIATDKTVRLAAISREPYLPGTIEPEGKITAETTPETRVPAILETLKTISLPTIAWLPGLEPGYRLQVPVADLIRRTLPEAHVPQSSPKWTAAQERAFGEVLRLVEMQQASTESLDSLELAHRRLQHPTSPQAGIEYESQQLPVFSAPSSPAGGELPAPKGFWFNVNAELIVYGATEPNARVTIGGRPIVLRPDGTFTCRFALPDGKYELPVVAVSTQEETRSAKFGFARRTEYHGEVGGVPQNVTPIP